MRQVQIVALVIVMGLSGHPQLQAQVQPASASVPANPPLTQQEQDYQERVVAYLHGNIPVTRAQLGEFLIARYGAEKLPLLVNRLIIEEACRKQGITVTPQEIEAGLNEDLADLSVQKQDFINVILKNYGKSLFEWEQDVIRPRLLLGKLCRDQIEVSDDDLHKMFEHLYGKKIRCRMILYPAGSERSAQKEYGDIRASDEAFDRAARNQANATLASAGGEIAPIAHHSFGESNLLEQEAFKLNPGELSRLITTKEGIVVLKCIEHIPADTSKKFEEERENLSKEVVNRKIQMKIPAIFQSLYETANPKLLLEGATSQEDLERAVREELAQPLPPSGKK